MNRPRRTAACVLSAVIALAACSAAGSTAPVRPSARARSRPGLSASTASADAVRAQAKPGSCRARGAGRFSRPDPRCTPGAVNPQVTQSEIGQTICRRGWTASVRPPESVTEPEKRAAMRAYGDSGPLHAYEYDHLIALELGGATNDPRNLWPERGASPNPKDQLERRLNRLVCERRMALAEAQRLIAGDWTSAYRAYIR